VGAPGTGRPSVVLAYQPNEACAAAIEAVLGADAEIVKLPDVPPEQRASVIRGAGAVIGWFPNPKLSDGELDALRGVPLIQLLSAGADRVPFDVLSPAPVAANVGAYAEPMAEHAVAMALALAKRLPQKHAELARGVFEQVPMNRRIAGSVCGVIGFGGIGKATADLMRAFGARIHAINTSGATDEPVEICGTLADLDLVLAASDFVILSVPLTRETNGLIGARQFAAMKPDAILVNVARGAIVDQLALYEHMRTHEAFSAAIDTWWVEGHVDGEFRLEAPFFELPNLLGSPHNSGFVAGIDVVAARFAAENVRRLLRGEQVRGLVDPADYAPTVG
jgi:phosphoglycerate dehydrogenase-like enzyme